MSTFLERLNGTLARPETKRIDAAGVEFKDDQVRRMANGPRYINWGTPQWSSADWDLDRLVRDGYERVIWVWKGVDAIAQHAANLSIRAVKGEPETPYDREFVDDPILRTLNVASWPGKSDKDAPIEMAWQFRYRLSSLLLLSKVGVYVEVVRTRGGAVHSLSLIHPGHCRPIPDVDKLIGAFRVDMADGGYTDLPPYNPNGKDAHSILWLRKPHPTDPLGATTPLQAAGISIDLDFWARLYNRTFLMNDGRPGGLLAIKGGMEQDDVDELRGRFGGGPSQAGRTTVIEADAVSWVDTAMSPRDAQYIQSRGITKEDILIALGTPESVMGNASGRTFDNADNEREVFWEFTMLPHLGIIERGFEALTAGGLYDEVRLWHDVSGVDSLQRVQRRKAAEARVDVQLGLASIDEFRAVDGREPLDLPETRVLWIPAAGRSPGGDPADVAKAKDIPIVAPPAGAPSTGKAGATVPGQGVMLPSMRRTISELNGKVDEPPAIEWKSWDRWPAIEAKADTPGVTPQSTMIAADVAYPAGVENAVMLAAGEFGMQPLDVDEWHVTLAFMGEPGPADLEQIDEVVDDNLPSTLLAGEISSPAVFGERGARRAIVLLVDIPGLAEYRTDLVRALDEAGVPQQSQHGYTAHMTVGYVEPDVSPNALAGLLTTLMSQAGQPITLPSIGLYVGSQRYEGPGEPDPFGSAGETGETEGKRFDPNQPRDADGRWVAAAARWAGAFGPAQRQYREAVDAHVAGRKPKRIQPFTPEDVASFTESARDLMEGIDAAPDVSTTPLYRGMRLTRRPKEGGTMTLSAASFTQSQRLAENYSDTSTGKGSSYVIHLPKGVPGLNVGARGLTSEMLMEDDEFLVNGTFAVEYVQPPDNRNPYHRRPGQVYLAPLDVQGKEFDPEQPRDPETGQWVTLYHLTDRAKFRLDPGKVPTDNALAIRQRSDPGLFLTGQPESWVNGHGYVRPFVAEIRVPADSIRRERWGDESFLPAENYDQAEVSRVIPLDAYAREQYRQHGWIEESAGTEFDTGQPITSQPWEYPFEGYHYDGPDVRDMTPEQVAEHRRRARALARSRREGKAFDPNQPRDPHTGQWFHGTRYTFKPGDVLEGGHSSNQGAGTPGQHVYFTTQRDVAQEFAEYGYGPPDDYDAPPKVYQVEPLDDVEADPDEDPSVGSWRSRRVRVVRRVKADTKAFDPNQPRDPHTGEWVGRHGIRAGRGRPPEQDWVDTPQQAANLRNSAVARKVRARFSQGTRVEALASGVQGTVLRHIPTVDAQGGVLKIRWDNGVVGRAVPGSLRVVQPEAAPEPVATEKREWVTGTNEFGQRIQTMTTRHGDYVIDGNGVPSMRWSVTFPDGDYALGKTKREVLGEAEIDLAQRDREAGTKFDPHQRRDAHGRWTHGGDTAVLDYLDASDDPFDHATQEKYRHTLAAQGSDRLRDTRPVVGHLKDGFGGFGSEDALRAAFETDLPGGFKARVSYISPPNERPPIQINGRILAPGGWDMVGGFERTLYPSQGIVEHDSLAILAPYRHKGLATAFIAHTTAEVEAAGYRKIMVFAAGGSEDGWKVWAQPEFGFRFTDGSAEQIRDRVAQMVEWGDDPEKVQAARDMLARFDSDDTPTPYEVYQAVPSAMANGWFGVRPLRTGTKSYLDDGMLHLECIPGPAPTRGGVKSEVKVDVALARRVQRREHLLNTLAAQDAEDLRIAEEDVKRAILDALERQERTVLARLTGTKARRHTRHWDPPGEAKIDPRYVLDLAKWRQELTAAVQAPLARAAAAGAHSVSKRLGLDPDAPLPGVDLVLRGALSRIVTGLLARFLEIQEIIAKGEASDASLAVIEEQVREAYTRKQAWATRAASDETVAAYNAGSIERAATSGKVMRKMWLSSRDERVRETHRHADGQTQVLTAPFIVGGFPLQYPGDPTGPPREVYNCRCTVLYQAVNR